MSHKAPAIPKPIQALISRESEMEAVVTRYSVDSYRAERDRLETLLHSGTATDAEIEAHANSRDGGPLDLQYQTLSASSATALYSYRRANWGEFRDFLRQRLKARRDREEAIQKDIDALRSTHGIQIDYSDPQAAVTSQLALLIEREDSGWISFAQSVETF
jgi:hypothetical protein